MSTRPIVWVFAALLLACAMGASAQAQTRKKLAPPARAAAAKAAALLIEMVYAAPSRRVLARVIGLIEKARGRAFDGDLNAWYDCMWSAERAAHPN